MDNSLVNNIRHALNKEFIRRSLIRYFSEKGFDDFNRAVYPPIVQDLPSRVPELGNKLEIIPFVKEINPTTGQATIGWNMFVLGTNRMALGESSHQNMQDLQQAVFGPTNNSMTFGTQSPADIIAFILKVLSASKNGMVHVQPSQCVPPSPRAISRSPRLGPTISGSYYERSRPG